MSSYTKMWQQKTIWNRLSSTIFGRSSTIVLSTQPRRFQRLMESYPSSIQPHRNWNGNTNAWPMSVMSKFSISTPTCGAVAMSMSESCMDDDDKLWQSSRVKLALGVLSVNTSVYAAFSLSHILRMRWKAASQLYQFMRNNFILSVEQFERRRWHVFLTYCCTHLDALHLLQNCFLTPVAFISEPPCVTIPLFLSGAVISAALVVFMLKRIREPNIIIVGGSGALYATISYSILNKDWKHIPSHLPHALLIGEVCRSAWHTANMRKGSKISPTFTTSQGGHFAGLILGISVYFISRVCSSASTKGLMLFQRKTEHVENGERCEHNTKPKHKNDLRSTII